MEPVVKKLLRESGSLSALGLEMGLSVGIGYLFGHWLDGKFGTEPVLTMVFIFFGFGAAGMALYGAYKKAKKLGNQEDSGDEETPE